MVDKGLPESEARRRCWFVDSKGLVVNRRDDLADYKRPFACDQEFLSDGVSIIGTVRPTALIGTTGKAGAFSPAILQAAAKINKRPIVFALSNPTSVAECTAQEAYEHTDGRAVFASGSPFDPVSVGGKTFAPTQANNAYIFPGVGLGAIASASRLVSDQMFLAAARALADQVSTTDLDAGRVYPRLKEIRKVSISIAVAVVETACRQNLATREMPEYPYIRSMMFEPEYTSYT
jgi:malate dehydrogenase (oxaloacetate-decarboxylating)(NADP+)